MKERLEKITQVILDIAKDRIAMVILFGSYARGDWVTDEYMEGHITYTYQSDFDIMLVMKRNKYTGHQGTRVESQIQNPTFDERREEAQDEYDRWFPLGCEFLEDCIYRLEKGSNNKAAFELHQATENFYDAILLVFWGYRPKTHDLEELKGKTSQYDPGLLKVFPRFPLQSKRNALNYLEMPMLRQDMTRPTKLLKSNCFT